MTVHSAKGLEFPVVFLPGMGGKHFPGHGERICTVRSGGGTPFSVCCHHACKRGAVHFPRGIPHDLRHDEPQPRFTLCGRDPGDARRAHPLPRLQRAPSLYAELRRCEAVRGSTENKIRCGSRRIHAEAARKARACRYIPRRRYCPAQGVRHGSHRFRHADGERYAARSRV